MKEQIAAVQRMQDYISEHMAQEITMSELAKVSYFSPWHSYRLFKEYVGLTPAEYIRKLRLSRSAVRLKKEGCPVLQAAYDAGFGSVDGYTRAFSREFGCHPGEYARDPVPIALFIPYGVKFRQLRKEQVDMENLQSVFVQVLRKPERKVIIKRGVRAEDYFAYCEEVSCDVWGMLTSMDSLCGEPVCLWLPEPYRTPGTSVYVQGVEVSLDDNGKIPDGFDVITLPAAEYLAVQGEPFKEEEYAQAILSVQYAIERYDPAVIGYEWDDTNPRIQLEPRGERGYIELRAIRKKATGLNQ
ncbi:MAG: AraC family transcriptional regulator [Eubacteriales bacterium]|nr:AraC family transcriptional regulator [Eubacteriales bacterium]